MEEKISVKYETAHGEVILSPQTIKRYLVSGDVDKVTDQEVMMFLSLCRYQRLNPFLREAYLIKYGEQPASLVVAKEAFTTRAVANPECTGWEAGIIVKADKTAIEKRTGTFIAPGEELLGAWARVHRKNWTVPLETSVSLSEYVRLNKEGKPVKNWREMPATMIRKVALVQALREAMPQELQGMYAAEEMPVDMTLLSKEPVQIDQPKLTQEQKEEAELSRARKALYAKSKELGFTHDEVKSVVITQFGIDSTKAMTKPQIISLIEHLEAAAKNKKEEEASEPNKN